MIKVSVLVTGSIIDIDVDADEAAIMAPEHVHGDDILVLEKDGQEVAWFRYWAYATKQEESK